MDQSDLLPRLKERIVEATDAAELDVLREDALLAWKYGDIMPSDVEDCVRMVHNQRLELMHRHRRAGELLQLINDCKDIESLTTLAKTVGFDYKREKISGKQYKSLCDAGRTRREELTQ